MPSGKPVLYAFIAAALTVAAGFAASRFGPNASAEAAAAPAPMQTGTRVWYPEDRSPVLSLPGGHRKTIHSVLNIRRPMKYGDFVWDDAGVPKGPLWVRADLGRQIVSVFRAGHEIGTAVILYGADSKPTPAGVFPVLEKDADYHSHTYDAPMPFMLRLTADGVAIHGSDVRERYATHGCIGVPLEFARKLYEQAQVGDEVFVLQAA